MKYLICIPIAVALLVWIAYEIRSFIQKTEVPESPDDLPSFHISDHFETDDQDDEKT